MTGILVAVAGEVLGTFHKLLFGQHKDTVTAVFKLQPGERDLRILFHQMYHAVAHFTNQHAVVGQIIRRTGQNAPGQFQTVCAGSQTEHPCVSILRSATASASAEMSTASTSVSGNA